MEPKLICDDFHEILIASRSYLGSRLAHHDETTQNAGVEHYVNFFVWLFGYFECAAPDVFALLHTEIIIQIKLLCRRSW